MENKCMVVTATSSDLPKCTIKTEQFEWKIDEPEKFGGLDSAPSPVETLLAAVASCVIAAGHLIASEMEMEIQDIKVTVEGSIDSAKFLGMSSNQRAGFKSIIVNISVNSDAPEDIKNEWMSEVIERCPVIDNLIKPVDIKLKLV